MTYNLTSNQLTAIHGDSPQMKKTVDDGSVERGIIIYLEMFGKGARGGIYGRIFYKNFDKEIPDQDAFEKAVVDKAKTCGFDDASKGKQWPGVFSDRVNEVNFGWRRCRVSYILNSNSAKFIAGAGPKDDDAISLFQPVVFRRDKIVFPASGKPSIERYLSNHTFYNLSVGSIEGYPDCSVIRFDNLMLMDADGTRMEEPSDPAERAKKKYLYCLDIHILVDQDTENGADAGGIVVVFDPPIANGGGGGPPWP